MIGLGLRLCCVFVGWDLVGCGRLVVVVFVRLLHCKFVAVCVCRWYAS